MTDDYILVEINEVLIRVPIWWYNDKPVDHEHNFYFSDKDENVFNCWTEDGDLCGVASFDVSKVLYNYKEGTYDE